MSYFTINTSIYFIAVLIFTLGIGLPNHAHAQNESQQESNTQYPNYRIVGFMQQQFIMDESPDSATRFTVNRARIGISGQITDRIGVNFVGGFVEPPSATPRLVNAFVDFDVHPLLKIRTGQFLVPFGLEGPEAIILNPAIERSMAIRRLNYFRMFRDIGVQLSGHNNDFTYAVALTNGAGANITEQIEHKDLMGRVGYNIIDGLNLGISGHLGYYKPDSSLDNEESRYRLGADLSYTGSSIFFRGEYIYRQDDRPNASSQEITGGYILLGYNISERIQTIARYEQFNPNTEVSDNELNIFTIGANYGFEGNTRLSVNYQIREDQMNSDIKNLLVVQLQLAL